MQKFSTWINYLRDGQLVPGYLWYVDPGIQFVCGHRQYKDENRPSSPSVIDNYDNPPQVSSRGGTLLISKSEFDRQDGIMEYYEMDQMSDVMMSWSNFPEFIREKLFLDDKSNCVTIISRLKSPLHIIFKENIRAHFIEKFKMNYNILREKRKLSIAVPVPVPIPVTKENIQEQILDQLKLLYTTNLQVLEQLKLLNSNR